MLSTEAPIALDAARAVAAKVLLSACTTTRGDGDMTFGALSAILSVVPVKLLPRGAIGCPNTAETNGLSINVNANWLMAVHDEDRRQGGATNGVLWVFLHEAMHILCGHVLGRAGKLGRAQGLINREINGLFDVAINSRLAVDFPEVARPPMLRHVLGSHPGATAQMSRLTEEQIITWYARDPESFCRAARIDRSSLGNADIHIVEADSEVQRSAVMNLRQQFLLKEHSIQSKKAGKGLRRGRSMCMEPIWVEVEVASKPRPRFPVDLPPAAIAKLRLHMAVSPDSPHDIRYCDHHSLGFKSPPFLEGWGMKPECAPTVLGLIDNSSSMTLEEVGHCVSDLQALAMQHASRGLKVLAQFYDNELIDQPVPIQRLTREGTLAQVRGRRDTNIGRSLDEALAQQAGLIQRGELVMILCFTDLLDLPPARPTRKHPSIIFICPPGSYSRSFALEVSDWARVLEAEVSTPLY